MASFVRPSPILSFSLDVYKHAIECYAGDDFKKVICILHLAQSVELVIKAALTNRNISIYEKENKTLGWKESAKKLAQSWHIDDNPQDRPKINNVYYDSLTGISSIEFLFDERNAMQHRYGSIDEKTTKYFFEETFEFISMIIEKEFDVDLLDWLHKNVNQSDLENASNRFSNTKDKSKPSDAVSGEAYNIDAFKVAFDIFDRKISDAFKFNEIPIGSRPRHMDVSIKALSKDNNDSEIRLLPEIYKSRNELRLGTINDVPEEDVKKYITSLDKIIDKIIGMDRKALDHACSKARSGIRGASIWEDFE